MADFSSCFKTMLVLELTEGKTPESERGTTPASDRGASPASDRGIIPETDRGTTPGSDRGKIPGTERGITPGTDRGTSPGTDRGTRPANTILPLQRFQEPARSQAQGRRRALVRACLLPARASPAPAAAPGPPRAGTAACSTTSRAREPGVTGTTGSTAATERLLTDLLPRSGARPCCRDPPGSPAVFRGSPSSAAVPGSTWIRRSLGRPFLPRAAPCAFPRPGGLGHDRFPPSR